MTKKITTEKQLREAWFAFWKKRQHEIVDSASLIPTHPSAPMFVNSGMMPFVPYFLDEEPVPFSSKRATSVQKCVRAGGKHNDLDAVGKSLRHLSFFEMMGNFSFGDYFKQEAIAWAWEFITSDLRVDKQRIWITVHLSDDEAEQIWREEIGVPAERIQRLDKDNFWEMGETGPCGPSTEMFYDFGSDYGPEGGPANPAAENRFIEFWNIVFMEFFRDASGNLDPLSKKHVDTGAGLERLVGVLRGSPSLYTCDTLELLVNEGARVSGRPFGKNHKDDQALRVIADHVRSSTFLIADGIIPSNDGRGYVLRRVIRRAVRFAYLLGVQAGIMTHMAKIVIESHKAYYPDLVNYAQLIDKTLSREESKFRNTLETGLSILDSELSDIPKGGTLSGDIVFMLYDTHGFPLEITSEIAEDKGYNIDTASFNNLMAQQRERARTKRKRQPVTNRTTDYRTILDATGSTDFVGRNNYMIEATVTGVLGSENGVELFLDRTPFYAEGGGQVGDSGTIAVLKGETILPISDTVSAIPGLSSHVVSGGECADLVNVGDKVLATIDVSRREKIMRNHTAVHLIHWALRKVLGEHVKQQGSHVGPDRLRFDFNHFDPMTVGEIESVEQLVNEQILQNAEVSHVEMDYDTAMERGALAFFGEKYSSQVRVLFAGEHSIELCGGTHVSALGQIGLVKIVSESSVGSNLRRIEAISGEDVLNELCHAQSEISAAASLIGVPSAQLQDGLQKRMVELQDLKAGNKALTLRLEQSMMDVLLQNREGKMLVTMVNEVDTASLKRLAEGSLAQANLEVVVLGTVTPAGRPAVVAAVKESFPLKAGAVLEPVSEVIGGGHGKQARLAVAGGRDARKIKEALSAASARLREIGATGSTL